MTTIQKIVLSVAAFFAATDISFSQTFSIVPNDTIDMVGIMEDLQTLSIQQLNTTNDTIQLKWVKVSESVPAAWEASACDNQVCNTSLVDSGMMNPVLPGDYGFLLMHITGHVNYGTAIIRYTVWDIANPTLKDTLTYILTINAPTGINEAVTKNTFRIFPNPANENINIISNIKSEFQFVVTDVSGKEIKKGISKTNSFSVSNLALPRGVYSISVVTEDKNITTKNFLVQH